MSTIKPYLSQFSTEFSTSDTNSQGQVSRADKIFLQVDYCQDRITSHHSHSFIYLKWIRIFVVPAIATRQRDISLRGGGQTSEIFWNICSSSNCNALANMDRAAQKIMLLMGLGGKLMLHYHISLSEFYRIFQFNIFTPCQLSFAY